MYNIAEYELAYWEGFYAGQDSQSSVKRACNIYNKNTFEQFRIIRNLYE